VEVQSARSQGLMLLTGAAAGFTALALRPPVAGAYPACPWRAITGLDCPFCGGLRASAAMLHGEWAAAVDYNVLVAVAVPLMLIGALAAVLLGKRAQPAVQMLTSGRALVVAFAVVMGFFVLRMLPFAGWLPSTA